MRRFDVCDATGAKKVGGDAGSREEREVGG